MAPAVVDRRGDAGESALWAAHLAVLRQALLMRKPDARDRVRSEVARLEREIAAMNGRRALARRSLRRDDACAAQVEGALCAQLDGQITERLRRVSDLAGLLRGNPPPRGCEDSGATPEAAMRPAATDPVVMLLGKAHLSEDQARAAREIAWIYEAMAKAGRARVSRMSQIDPPAGWQEMPLSERAALLHAKRFLPWAKGLRRDCPVTLDIVLQVAVLGLSLYAVARRHRLGWKTCVNRLAQGLDRYWRPVRATSTRKAHGPIRTADAYPARSSGAAAGRDP